MICYYNIYIYCTRCIYLCVFNCICAGVFYKYRYNYVSYKLIQITQTVLVQHTYSERMKDLFRYVWILLQTKCKCIVNIRVVNVYLICNLYIYNVFIASLWCYRKLKIVHVTISLIIRLGIYNKRHALCVLRQSHLQFGHDPHSSSRGQSTQTWSSHSPMYFILNSHAKRCAIAAIPNKSITLTLNQNSLSNRNKNNNNY